MYSIKLTYTLRELKRQIMNWFYVRTDDDDVVQLQINALGLGLFDHAVS